MEDKELQINRKKHVLYSKKVKALILDKLNSRYSPSIAENKWEKIQKQYAQFLTTLPYLGGKHCRHNGAGGTYDCIALCSYYTVEKTSPYLSNLQKAISELYNMNNALFVPSFSRMGKIINANSSFSRRILHLAFRITAKVESKISKKTSNINKEDEWPGGGYIMKVAPYDKNRVYYRFNRCPIAEFAKKNNLLPIMPAFCNGDFPALKEINASLIRNHTCSNSDFCDFLIVGNNSEDAKNHPIKVSDDGYIYTDKIDNFQY